MAAVEHPTWCDPEHCTTPAEQPTTPEPGAKWEHRSAPVRLDLDRTRLHWSLLGTGSPLAADETEPKPFSAWLAQPLSTGWGGGRTYLRIGIGQQELLGLDMSPGEPDMATIGQLAHLVATAQAEIQAHTDRVLGRR
jgi:hypothetical protein